MGNVFNADGHIIGYRQGADEYLQSAEVTQHDKPTLESLQGLVDKMDAVIKGFAKAGIVMSGRDDREATTERERRKREDEEGKARARDAEREAEDDEQSLGDYAKRRIANLEDVLGIYRACLRTMCGVFRNLECRCAVDTRTINKAHAEINTALDRHEENPDDK